MAAKKKPIMFLDVTKPNGEGNYYLLNTNNKVVGEVPAEKYMKNPEKYMNEEIMPITYTGWRKPTKTKSKIKRKTKTKDCGCK